MTWKKLEAGWYRYWVDRSGGVMFPEADAAVCYEGDAWCVYVTEDMPPGDSQHKTLKEAKKAAEKLVGKQGEDERCMWVERVGVHRSVVIGGVSLGRCKNKRFPGMVYCFEHTNKEALSYMVRTLLADFEKETGRPHSFVAHRKKTK